LSQEVVHGDVPAVMRDGKTLMSDVYSPASGGPYPVLLTRLPNGSVGMQPPSLRSMAPGQTWGNHLNGVQWRGGAGELGLMHYWAQAALAFGLLFRKYRGEPERIQRRLPALVGSIDALLAGGGYDALPLADLPDRGGLTPFVRGAFDRGVDHENFVARLVDVYPDARAIVVTDGIIRASARERYPAPGVIRPAQPSPVEPGRVYEYSVDMWQTAIPSSSFPRWDRNPNTGESSVYSAHTNVARQPYLPRPPAPEPHNPDRSGQIEADG
jgi:predicted acyl esterase